ncbi:MAG: DUF2723 domain-containing protein [Anaerolineae bacterium]
MSIGFSARKKDFLISAVLFAVSFLLYLHTLAPTVAAIFDDSLEFQLVAYQLGIAHPTGYPLYTLLGKVFTLLPLGDVAYRVNLMSAVFGALTISFLYLTAHRIIGYRLPAMVAALGLAVSPVFWSQAVVAEVYTLNATFVALVLFLLLEWEDTPQAPGQGVWKSYLAVAVYGLSLTHHRTMLLLAPAMALYAWLTNRRLFTDFRSWGRLALALLTPLLLYLYIPIRGLSTTSLDGAYQNTLPGFLRWVTSGGYTVFLTENPLAQQRPLSFYFNLFLDQFGMVGVALGLLGLLHLRRSLKLLALLGLAFLTNFLFALGYRVADIEVFLIPTFLLFAFFLGAGIYLVSQWLMSAWERTMGTRPPAVQNLALALVVAVYAVPGLSLAIHNLPGVDLNQRWEVRDYGLDVLHQRLEERATIIGILGEMTLLRYLQQTEGVRTDIVTMAADREPERLAAVEREMAVGHDVYLTRPLPSVEEKYPLAALGPLIKVRSFPETEFPSPPFGTIGPEPFAGRVSLAYDQPLVERDHVRVSLYWQAVQPLSEDYKVSVRLLDDQGHLFGQKDDQPVHNAYPTSAWRQGEIVPDVYDVPILAGHPADSYRLVVTLYQPQTNRVVGTAELPRLYLPQSQGPLATETWGVAERVGADFGGRVTLLGYTVAGGEFGPGDTIPLTFLWQAALSGEVLPQEQHLRWRVPLTLLWQAALSGQARQKLEEPIRVRVWLEDETHQSWAQEEESLELRHAGQVLRTWSSLTVPPNLPDGAYQIKVSLLQGGEPLSVRRWWILPGPTSLSLGTIRVRGRERIFSVPPISHPLEARLGEGVKLLGYDLTPTTVEPGQALHLTLYWQALAEMVVSYKVFNHLVDGEGRIWGQHDSLPGAGTLPTTGWVAGEVIVDGYDILVSGEAPPGEYRLIVGMYDPANGNRLPAFDGEGIPLGDSVPLEEVWVAGE